MAGRTIAIGDIHGCAQALATLLKALAPQPGDTIITLGDYVDRGPDSRQVVERLIELAEHCTLVPLLGNHEEMMLLAHNNPKSAALQNWLHAGGAATLESYGFGNVTMEIPASHLVFLDRCVSWHQTETHLFLHANYDENVAVESLSPYQLRWESLRDRMPMRHISGKTAIVGHTAQKEGEVLDRGYLKCIDTYCYGGGWLTALDVETNQLWQSNEQGELRSR